MNFAELKDQVFELIDRETFDPQGVHELLAALPGGRAYFERMKAALALAELFPLEEPPAGLDARILAKSASFWGSAR